MTIFPEFRPDVAIKTRSYSRTQNAYASLGFVLGEDY
jgi:hypothetical protein